MTTNILILCTHNSARSVLAEAMLNFWAMRLNRNVRAFSAGSAPAGAIHPHALRVLHDAGIPIEGLRSKSWDEFASADSPRMRVVITVCDSVAAEPCPYWPASPVQVHWDSSRGPHACRRCVPTIPPVCGGARHPAQRSPSGANLSWTG